MLFKPQRTRLNLYFANCKAYDFFLCLNFILKMRIIFSKRFEHKTSSLQLESVLDSHFTRKLSFQFVSTFFSFEAFPIPGNDCSYCVAFVFLFFLSLRLVLLSLVIKRSVGQKSIFFPRFFYYGHRDWQRDQILQNFATLAKI